jgi:hypothetical protein
MAGRRKPLCAQTRIRWPGLPEMICFGTVLLDADMIVPDGSGIVLASRILGGRIRERITGSDVFRGVNEAMNRMGQGSCFFLGATEETLAAIRARMAVDFPNVWVAGTYSPPFNDEFTGFSLSCSETKIHEKMILVTDNPPYKLADLRPQGLRSANICGGPKSVTNNSSFFLIINSPASESARTGRTIQIQHGQTGRNM